jgi:hypothetical protein
VRALCYGWCWDRIKKKIYGTYRETSNNEVEVVAGPVMEDSQWHHVALVRESQTTMQLYVDGVAVGTASNASLGTITVSNARVVKISECITLLEVTLLS